ncbi:MAG TPA: VWA domain-containing protein [Chloroflexota bacterium]|nr:VWA domain-containing protein [Chloroflexota bacterium]
MISFSQPQALFGLVVLPILLLFYMWRARHSRQVISSIWLWQEAVARFSHRPTRRLPLRDPLLLLQLLAALLLVLFLAGPRAGHTNPVHQIVVLDDSVAMAATDLAPSRFAQAKQRVQSLIDHLGDGDHLSLILAGPRARLLGQAPSAGDPLAALRALPPPNGPADLVGAAALARGLAETPSLGPPRVTFIAANETPALPVGNLSVTTVRLGHTLDDQSISDLSVACSPHGGTCEAFARLHNADALPQADALAAWADGQSLGQQPLTLPARGSLDLSFVVPSATGVVRAALTRPDALPENNAASALAPNPPSLRALLVSDTPGPLLRALQGVPGLSVRVVSIEAYQDTDAVGPDLIVMDGIAPVDLLTVPLLAVNPPANNVLVNVRSPNVFLPMTLPDPTDPLVSGLDLDGLPTVGEAIDTPAWASADVDGPKGPLVVHGSQSGERMVILPWEPSTGAFSQDVSFPLLIERLVRWLAPVPAATISAGTPLWLPTTVQSVRSPTGAILTGPLIEPQASGLYLVADATGSLTTGAPLFAVPPASPGEVAPASVETPPWAPLIAAAGLPRALWPWALLAALIALSGEWVYYARKT